MAFVWNIDEYVGRVWNGLRRVLDADVRDMHGAGWQDHVAKTLACVPIDYAREREDPAYGRLLDEILRNPEVREIWDLCEVVYSSQTSRNSILAVDRVVHVRCRKPCDSKSAGAVFLQIPNRESEMCLWAMND